MDPDYQIANLNLRNIETGASIDFQVDNNENIDKLNKRIEKAWGPGRIYDKEIIFDSEGHINMTIVKKKMLEGAAFKFYPQHLVHDDKFHAPSVLPIPHSSTGFNPLNHVQQ